MTDDDAISVLVRLQTAEQSLASAFDFAKGDEWLEAQITAARNVVKSARQKCDWWIKTNAKTRISE